jgi:predicted CXXCH cytochrome family protein
MGTGRYTTKGRAKRIQLDYFKQLHPFRRWRLILSVAAPLLAALTLAGFALRGHQRIYNSGPVSMAHAMFGAQCGNCHVPTAGRGGAGGFFRRPSDQSCSACHAGPIHHENQVGPQTCTSCHVEHQGRAELAALPDHHCTRCHADLATKDGRPPQFATKVTSFDRGHPEFAVTVKDRGQSRRIRLDQMTELKDTSQIKLNHEKHLATDLGGVEDIEKVTGMRGLVRRDKGLALGCTYCHETDDRRAQMKPIDYTRHCVACHPLDFDARFAGATVPHAKPSVVHAFLRTASLEGLEKCQGLPPAATSKSLAARTLRKQCEDLDLVKDQPETGGTDRPRGAAGGSATERKAEEPASDQPRGRRLLGGDATREPAGDRPRGAPGGRAQETEPAAKVSGGPGGSGLEWVANVESFMFKQRCQLCHVMTFTTGQLPEVAPPAIPVRWLPHSVFDHGVHRPVACLECHKAATSKETTDVLLPSVSVCRECHRSAGGARAGCVECHLHHDKNKERDLNGPFTIERLRRSGSR